MRTRTLWSIALLLLTVYPARAQEEAQAPQEPARFLIETITVEGPKEAAANIVRAEALLRPGETYTEDQLRHAVYRVHRLPFVLDASFSLRKGSRRGAYELVIQAQPARWFFFDHWIRAFRFDQPLDLEDSFRSNMRSSFNLGGLVGARLFVGRSGVLFGALDSEEGVQVGFTQYDLFHRGILASAGYSINVCCVREVLPLALDPTFSFWGLDRSEKASLGLAFPLGSRQSVQVALSERRGTASIHRDILVNSSAATLPAIFEDGGEITYRRAETKWVYDTSDDPLVPTRGFSVSAGIEAARFESRELIELRFDPFPGPNSPQRVPLLPFRSEQAGAAVSAIRHRSLTPRQTISVTGRLSGGRSRLKNLSFQDRNVPEVDLTSFGGSLGFQHALTLKRSRRTGDFSDLRLETGAELGIEKTAPNLGPSPLERFSAWLGLVFRNQWGRVRLLLSYLDLGEALP